MLILIIKEKQLGVELLVDFNGRGHMKNMKSLSGGQKAVVGLVFIPALQVDTH